MQLFQSGNPSGPRSPNHERLPDFPVAPPLLEAACTGFCAPHLGNILLKPSLRLCAIHFSCLSLRLCAIHFSCLSLRLCAIHFSCLSLRLCAIHFSCLSLRHQSSLMRPFQSGNPSRPHLSNHKQLPDFPWRPHLWKSHAQDLLPLLGNTSFMHIIYLPHARFLKSGTP